MNQKKKSYPRGMTSNRTAMLSLLVVVCLLMISLFVVSHKLSKRVQINKERLADVEEQIEKEEQRTTEIKEMQEYMQSDEYLEKVAKDKLGLVRDNEIIFKEEN